MFSIKCIFSFVIFSVTNIEDLHALVMKDPKSLWEFEVVSRIDLDPGNHGKRKCIITTEEFKRRISPPENLGHSVATIQGILKLGKNKKTVNLVRDIIRKLEGVDENSPIVTSSLTLVPEGNLQFFFQILLCIMYIDDPKLSQTVFSLISYLLL